MSERRASWWKIRRIQRTWTRGFRVICAKDDEAFARFDRGEITRAERDAILDANDAAVENLWQRSMGRL